MIVIMMIIMMMMMIMIMMVMVVVGDGWISVDVSSHGVCGHYRGSGGVGSVGSVVIMSWWGISNHQ